MVHSLRCQSKMPLTYLERPKLIGTSRPNLTCTLTEPGFCTKYGASGVCLPAKCLAHSHEFWEF